MSGNEISTYQLKLLGEELSGGAFPGYPQFSDRLFAPLGTLATDVTGRLVVPSGPWEIPPQANDRPAAAPQTPQPVPGQERDSYNRPLHPWLGKMLGNKAVGAVFGMGFFWEWGENPTADPIIIKRNHLLLIRRRDTGALALPGGFIERNEDSLPAARRETQEETTLIIPSDAVTRARYKGPIVDIRLTGNAWPVGNAHLFDLGNSGRFPKVEGRDDAKEALWMPTQRALNSPLFGAHRFLIRHALGLPLR